MSRRSFLKLNVFGAGAVVATSLVTISQPASKAALAAAAQPNRFSLPQPTFKPIASTTAFGTPTDISMGWDGTLWAIDASGSPHLYDPLQNIWLPHGDGMDGAAHINGVLYFFRGSQVLQLNLSTSVATLSTIAEMFPNLPDSFKLGVVGAANVSGELVLFNGGRYVRTTGAAQPQKLTDLPNWPKTAPWQDGLITSAFGDGSNLILMNGAANLIYVNLLTSPQLSSAGQVKDIFNWGDTLPGDWLTAGFDGGFPYYVGTELRYALFKGTAVAQFVAGSTSRVAPTYIPTQYANWPATWHPRLAHAPSGRMDHLWCATTDTALVQYDGGSWVQMPGNGKSVSVGQDGSVWVGNAGGLFRWNGTDSYDALGSSDLVQVSAGDAQHVWVRQSQKNDNTDNVVYRYDPQSDPASPFKPASLGAGVPTPTHLAANADGTLWHCTDVVATLYRFLADSEAASAALALPAGVVVSVQKVASTGFGQAYVLAKTHTGSMQLYTYDSPYLFKTADSYVLMGSGDSGTNGHGGVMLHAGGRVYGTQLIKASYTTPNPFLQVRFVALDAHTGDLIASCDPTQQNLQYTGLVHDALHNLIYVGAAPLSWNGDAQDYDQTTPGQLIAFDAATLEVKWVFTTAAGVDATPGLSGTHLCFGDRQGNLYMFDTRQAAAVAAGMSPTPVWTWQLNVTDSDTHRISTPAFFEEAVYVAVWGIYQTCEDPCTFSNSLAWYTCRIDGTQRSDPHDLTVPKATRVTPGMTQPPVLGHANFAASDSAPADLQRALFINGDDRVYATSLATPNQQRVHLLPPGTKINTGFAYDDGTREGQPLPNPNVAALPVRRLFFGDNTGQLWSLNPSDTNFAAADGTPVRPISGNTVKPVIQTTPVLYKDAQGDVVVLFGVIDTNNVSPAALWAYDPQYATLSSIATGVTYLNMLSDRVENGLIYCGGYSFQSSVQRPSQVFGIRVDDLPQSLRDFVIESQLMQDPDESAAGHGNITPGQPLPANPIPNSVARYQTHLTVVDDQKHPRPHEPVKIWSDVPQTKISVDGQPFTIGPDDGSFALIKTGLDGMLVITTDATDYFAPTLRVWAGFMNPYERIVINADAEFHQRVMTAHASANDTNPAKVNLQTAATYSGKSLFTDDEKKQNPSAPQNVANSIQEANKGLGLSAGNGSSKGLYRRMMRAMGVKHKNQRVHIQLIEAQATADNYMAYADLPGAAHFPTNIPSTRLAPAVKAVGLSYARPGGDPNAAPIFTALSHADARTQIDALEGQAWKPGDSPGGQKPRRTFNIFQDFWNWLKNLFDKILQCILSIAEDILAGIQYVVDGLKHVFKAIIKVLEDMFPFLGSFFKMLEKIIDDVVMALSVLFNFGEVIWTHRWLAEQFQLQVTNLKAAIATTIQPALDGFFKTTEDDIKKAFDTLRGDLGGSQQINNIKGADATPHSALKLGPRGGPATLHATQCCWSTQKLKTGLPSTKLSPPALRAQAAAAGEGVQGIPNAIGDFFTTFVARLTGDGDLSASVQQLQSDFGHLFHASSVSGFFKTLLITLLDIVETLVEGAVAVGHAFADGILAIIDDAIQAVMSVMNAEIDIPVLTWLYEKLFGEKLTLLNMTMLVTAIPVTILFRVVAGKYPSQAGLPTAGGSDANALSTQVASSDAQLALGLCVSFLSVIAGAANLWSDIGGLWGGELALVFNFFLNAFTFPLIYNEASAVSNSDWAVYGFSLAILLVGIGSVSSEDEEGEPTTIMDGALQSWLYCILNLGMLITSIVAYRLDGKTDGVTNVGFAENIVSSLDGLVNPTKLWEGEWPALVGMCDVMAGIILMFLNLGTAVTHGDYGAPLEPHTRMFFPIISASE